MRRLALAYGLTEAAIDYETEKFRDHFRASGDRKVDWAAAWRNWMRRASEMRASRKAVSFRSEDARLKVEEFLRIARGEV